MREKLFVPKIKIEVGTNREQNLHWNMKVMIWGILHRVVYHIFNNSLQVLFYILNMVFFQRARKNLMLLGVMTTTRRNMRGNMLFKVNKYSILVKSLFWTTYI